MLAERVLTERELNRAVLARQGLLEPADGTIPKLVGRPHAIGVGQWIDLVRVPPAGTWQRRRADLFAAAEDWVSPAPDLDEAGAREQLVRSYLKGFGPASRADIASYTGLAPRDIAPTLEAMRLRRLRSASADELLDVPRAPLPDPQTPAPVRPLPTWDATLLVHARRARILPEEHRPRIFHVRNPHSTPTFLVGGAVAGTWKYAAGTIELEPFERLDAATRRELRVEADRLAQFHA